MGHKGLLITVCIMCLMTILFIVPSNAANLDTNLVWSPGSGNQKFTCTATELKVDETYETAYAVSDKIVDGKESFIFHLEYIIQKTSNSEAIARNGWISQAVHIGTVRFYLNQKTDYGPYFGVQKYRIDMTQSEATSSKISIRVLFDKETRFITYEVNGRYIVSVPFEESGALTLSSSWCAWTVDKAVYTSYPDGIPDSLWPERPVDIHTASPSAPPYTQIPTNTRDVQSSLPAEQNHIILIVATAIIIVMFMVAGVLLVCAKRRKGAVK